MMDYGLSDAEERQVFGWDDDICERCGGFGECADGNCDECPVCEDLDECECDYVGTSVAAALARADDQIKAMKEDGNWPWWK